MTTNWTNVTTVVGFLDVANQTTGDLFWIVMLFMVCLVMFMALMWTGLEVALITSLFMGIVFSSLLLYLNLIPLYYVWIMVASEIFIVIYLVTTSPRNN